MFDFELNSELPISKLFNESGIHSFSEAMHYVKNLPYGRNFNRKDFTLVLKEQKGSCSSKHALLKLLADENNHSDVQLTLGIFRMNGNNTPKVAITLEKFGLEYIPEAHNYLKIQDEIYDCTTQNSSEINFVNNLLKELEIRPKDVISKKIEIHQEFLKNWCKKYNLNFNEIWKIREQCIADLGSNSKQTQAKALL